MAKSLTADCTFQRFEPKFFCGDAKLTKFGLVCSKQVIVSLWTQRQKTQSIVTRNPKHFARDFKKLKWCLKNTHAHKNNHESGKTITNKRKLLLSCFFSPGSYINVTIHASMHAHVHTHTHTQNDRLSRVTNTNMTQTLTLQTRANSYCRSLMALFLESSTSCNNKHGKVTKQPRQKSFGGLFFVKFSHLQLWKSFRPGKNDTPGKKSVCLSLTSDSSETINVIIIKLGTLTVSDMKMYRVLIILNLTFIQDKFQKLFKLCPSSSL